MFSFFHNLSLNCCALYSVVGVGVGAAAVAAASSFAAF